jgi:hypothetical protein
LRREVPGRSVAQIIQILEWEGQVVQKYGVPDSVYFDYAEELTMPKDSLNHHEYLLLPKKLRHSFH